MGSEGFDQLTLNNRLSSASMTSHSISYARDAIGFAIPYFPITFYRPILTPPLHNMQWVLALFSLYGTLCPDARELLSIMFDASQAETEPKCLRKIHSYLDYMSTAYQETHVREPSIDLVNRFKMDLERAASSPHSSERNLPAVGNGEGCSSSDRGVDSSLGIGCDSGIASRGIVGVDTEGRDRSITGPPSLCSISELGPARTTIV